LLLQFFSYWS